MINLPLTEVSPNYLEWNDRLAAHFFNEDMSGRPVYLYASNDLISEIGNQIGVDVEDFVAAAKHGPPWVTHGELCQRALQASKDWRARGRSFPPYIGYLCLFVLAAGEGGNFAPHAYYPRLRKILNYPDGGMLPSFNRMLELWDDLEIWSTENVEGRLGLFTARIAGNWIHVGLPIAQVILTENERKVLPKIFFSAGLDPTSTPSAEVLVRALRTYGPGELQRRTLNLLSVKGEREICDALLDIVADELFEWDGEVEADTSLDGNKIRSFSVARLCLAFDRIANQAHCNLRLRINKDFPEERFLLNTPEIATGLDCEEFVARWSTPLRYVDDKGLLDASTLNWAQETVFRDERLKWQFKLPGRTVRLLANGLTEGLPGLFEIHALPRSEPFYLLYSDRESKTLSSWLRDDCRGVREFGHVHGLPVGWKMAFVQEAVRDFISQEIPSLSFPSVRRISFLGGLRASAGNTFFTFAPPTISVDGDGTEEIFCNQQLLTPTTAGGRIYELPKNLQANERVLVEIKSGDFLARKSLYLTYDFTWKLSAPLRVFNRWGDTLQGADDRTPVISGAIVLGPQPDVSEFRRQLSTHFDCAITSRVFYIGRRTGEIVSWPSEALPDQWMPVWAVPLGRRGHAFFCGEDPSNSLPDGSYGAPKERHDLWKKVLWHGRKRIVPPRQPMLMKLWQSYTEAAREA